MEIRLSSVLLAATLLCGCSWFHRGGKAPAEVVVDAPPGEPTVVEPQVPRREVKTPKIKAKDIELGGYFGVISIQDFGTNPIYGCAPRTTSPRTFSWRRMWRAPRREPPASRMYFRYHGSQRLWETLHVLRLGRRLQRTSGRDISRPRARIQFGFVRDGRHGRREVRRCRSIRVEHRSG